MTLASTSVYANMTDVFRKLYQRSATLRTPPAPLLWRAVIWYCHRRRGGGGQYRSWTDGVKMRVRYRGYVDRGNSRKWMCNDWTVKKGDGQMGDSQTVKMVDG